MAEQAGAPAVSVVMNCLNCSRYVREAIDSVYAQSFQDWEIVFWDNASSDESASIARSFDERVKYYRGTTTEPLGQARNRALGHASAPYIAFLDTDDLWLPDKLERQLPLFDDPTVGIVFSDTYFFKEGGRRRPFYGTRGDPPRGAVFRRLLKRYNLSLETVVIRRKALEGLDQPFDPDFEVIEEKDLFLRIAHDWKLDYVDAPLAMWRVHDGSWTWQRQDLFPKETERMLDKFAGLYADFEQDFAGELRFVRAGVRYQYAMADWKRGERRQARRRLRPDMLRNKRSLLAYFLSFFPYGVYRKALSRFRVLP